MIVSQFRAAAGLNVPADANFNAARDYYSNYLTDDAGIDSWPETDLEDPTGFFLKLTNLATESKAYALSAEVQAILTEHLSREDTPVLLGLLSATKPPAGQRVKPFPDTVPATEPFWQARAEHIKRQSQYTWFIFVDINGPPIQSAIHEEDKCRGGKPQAAT